MKAIETDEVLMIDRSMVLEEETIANLSSTSPDSEAHCSRDFVRITTRPIGCMQCDDAP